MILLFSGGLDSYIGWHYLDRPKTLYLDIGHRYCVHEVSVVKALIPDTIIDTRLNLASFEEADANIPMRNAFFLMIAAWYDDEIALIVQQGEMTIPDRSPKFFQDFSGWLAFLNERPMRIFSPFFNMTKSEMVEWYLNDGGNPQKLIQTRSCYSPGDIPCGKCSACFRRWVAFQNNALEEEYANPILEYEKIPDYIYKMKLGEYDKKRTRETFNALKMAGYKF